MDATGIVSKNAELTEIDVKTHSSPSSDILGNVIDHTQLD
jgi:hypothetical protein